MKFDIEAFEERAAIMEFCGGLSRFEAETLAAKLQGKTRREAMNAKRVGNTATGRDNGSLARQPRADNLPGMQRGEAQAQ